jgi:Fe-Mn family superoxide dismutase
LLLVALPRKRALSLPDLPYAFNALVQALGFQSQKIEEILRSLDSAPAEVRTAVRNHGGGHYNHSLFGKLLSPKGGGKPSSALAAAANLFGSGWAWLCADGAGKLSTLGLPNQDSPLSQGLKPILGIDVWEHTYYLKHQNRRPDYLTAVWNVVSWEQVALNFEASR